MNNDSILKKEFQNKDVNRLRNLITGKYGEKTRIGVGYNKQEEFHSEGDIWEEDGRNWTIKNGLKQNITKLDKAKEGIILPLFCPSCAKTLKPHLDKQWYIMYNHCFNCQVDFEAQLKKDNKLEDFEKELINDQIQGMTKDFEVWVDELINEKETFITEAGDIEKWDGTGKHQLLKYKEEALNYLKSSLKK